MRFSAFSQLCFSYDHCACRLYNCICMRSKTSPRRVLRYNYPSFILIFLWYPQILTEAEVVSELRSLSASTLSVRESKALEVPTLTSICRPMSLTSSTQNISFIESTSRSLHKNAPSPPTLRSTKNSMPICGVTSSLSPFFLKKDRHRHSKRCRPITVPAGGHVHRIPRLP